MVASKLNSIHNKINTQAYKHLIFQLSNANDEILDFYHPFNAWQIAKLDGIRHKLHL
jgi:hypothetical protein